MKTDQIDIPPQKQGSGFFANASQSKSTNGAILLALVLAASCFGFGGCAADGYVGVSAYPDYSPYYGYYGYDGSPFYGYGGIYRRDIIIRGAHYRGGFGQHHVWGDRGGGGHNWSGGHGGVRGLGGGGRGGRH